MEDQKYTTVTDEELIDALKLAGSELRGSSFANLRTLLHLVVNRLVETSEVFNSHEHRVSGVRTSGDEYHSAGEGWTGAPASDRGYGCERYQRIGKPMRDDEDRGW